ncbi:phb depolymerase family esterase [Stagonosporopsis vannaccii]|nr:phb depolymerase family esterase [Stagonosporopsis vannaccii]
MRISTYFLLNLGTASAMANGALTRVTNFGNNPTNLEMNIVVPPKLASKPAIILALHGCFGSGEAYAAQTAYDTLAEQKGFIVIYPSSKRDSNCWEVNTSKGLSRNAGGDNQGLVSMVNYSISKYAADPAKVFVTGSSSGCMMTNVLVATYPDVFAAATCYSGVAAGCLAGSPGASPISADARCANGLIIKSQAEWVRIAKAMYSGYNGKYPRLATWHGTADTLVTLPNLGEQLKQWSGVQGVAFVRNVTSAPEAGYTKIVYGDESRLVGYEARGVGHTVPVHEREDLAWFGI